VEFDKEGDENSHSLTSPRHAGRNCSLSFKETEDLTDSLKSQFQLVYDPSDPAVIEKVAQAL
jgi:hypothetical protein